MTESRIQFNNIVRNQLPLYVKEEFPLVEEFLSQYYLSQEFSGAPIDLIQNIDKYIKLDQLTNKIDFVFLSSDVSTTDETIFVDILQNPSGTLQFPDKYGLIKIDDEIITYTGKTFNSFTGCIRGFSGISSYTSLGQPDQLVFSKTEVATHEKNSVITNLSFLFLREFLIKIKHQLTPGFENREFTDELNESIFIKQAKDFYNSKGTDESFKILFKSLYGEDVSVIKPKDYIFTPSNAGYEIVKSLVVESIEGNPEDLENSTIYQYDYQNYTKAYAPITKVERVQTNTENQYYKLSIDDAYDRDIRVDGATYGNFKIHSQTKVIGTYDSNSTTIDVDSTIGFPLKGELFVTYNDGSTGVTSYSSKSIDQFFGCTNISGVIENSSVVGVNTFASNKEATVKVRITSILKDVDIVDESFHQKKGYLSSIKTLGVNPKDSTSNNWIFNICPSYSVESILLLDDSDKTYRVTTNHVNIFRVGDTLKIKGTDNIEKDSIVLEVVSNRSFNIKGQGELLISDKYIVQKNILKANSSTFSDVSNFKTNVQNVYKDKNKVLVASSSLPYYREQSLNVSRQEVVFSGTFVSDTFKITDGVDHGFYTGDRVYYSAQKQVITQTDSDGNTSQTTISSGGLFDEGTYFVKRIDPNNIKLALSRSNIYNSKFITLDEPITVSSNKLSYYNLDEKTLSTQKLLREIDSPVNDGQVYETFPGFTGILVNGVEIANYKSKDVVYFGPLEKIEVFGSGQDYDVINPPALSINDPVGTGASGYCSVRGSLIEIRIIDPGFDYLEIPTIKITGGNGSGAKALANMKLVDHDSIFNSEVNTDHISLTDNTIGFSTYHKFRNAERVIYNTDSQRGVGGLSTNSSYYVSVQSPTKLKLHKTFNDAVSGIGTVQFTSFGIGNHSLKSFTKKLVIGSINIEDSGSGYENKKRTIGSTIIGINTSSNQINILEHDFKNGEIVKYSKQSSESEIGGLVNNSEYYVTVVDENNFKLSEVGSGSIPKDFYYNTKQYIDLTSVGSGIHTFNYPEIKVEIIGTVGGSVPLPASVEPIFRGEISSVHLVSNGTNYGTSEILNFNKQPNISLFSGSGAQVTPIVSNGRIVEVLINSRGTGYNSSPNLSILGEGSGAILTPIVENGQLVEIKVIQSGFGYSQNSTDVIVTPSGSLSELSVKIKTWNINLFQRLLPLISGDDGILTESTNSDYGLQYAHLYAPRKLREILYPHDQDGNILYGKRDLRKSFNKEINSSDHSPIIGWAYDGNPIYGPYGYISREGGIISQMKSGYKISLKPNRPPLSNFPEGFFVEDYTHFGVSDDTVLDENNGRFCVTPEFPNGTYAYFCTINNGLADSSGTFSGYKKPVFPYFIGNTYKSKPNNFNFNRSSNQDSINLNETNWSRNTTPYNLIESDLTYNYLQIPNLLNQIIETKYAIPGFIENITVVSGGENYKIKDKVIFNNEGTDGYNANAEVGIITGKHVNSISVASTTNFNLDIYPFKSQESFILFSENPHSFNNSDNVIISGFSTTSSLPEGFYRIQVPINTISLSLGVGNTSVTGIITYFSVSGNLNFPNIKENDIFEIGTEQVKVLNIDTKLSKIKVLREINGSVGSAHSSTEILYEIPRKIVINSGIKTQYSYKINKEIYFNPLESVGIGTTSGVGIGSIINIPNSGIGITQIFIPTQSIYIPKHQLLTGDELIYSSNGGSTIGVSTNGISTSLTIGDQSIVYVAKISEDLIGISTFKVGLSTEGNFVGLTSENKNYGLLYFTDLGLGQNHSFKTTYSNLTASVSKNLVTVSTAQSHGLLNNDLVFIDVNPSIATTFIVKYNDYNRKLVVNPKDFTSSDVNISTNTITIVNHGFRSGQKVIYTSAIPSSGLLDNKEYYVFVVDINNIRLTNSFHESQTSRPSFVDINSASDGTLSLINPPIEVYVNSSVVFDLSDSSLSYVQQSISYPAFEFKLYKDSNFSDVYDSNLIDSEFEVRKVGIVGVTSDAKVTLTVNNNTPENLYYSLIPLYDGNLPENKQLINTDDEVHSNNEIQLLFSKYNGFHGVVSTSSTTFTYTIDSIPERNSYINNSNISYYVSNSNTASGSIVTVDVLNGGENYYSLPTVSEIKSSNGIDAILNLESTSIGRIKNFRIRDVGFNFPSDFTLRPSLSIPQVIKVDPLSSFESIEVSSIGIGYNSAPNLLVFDGVTGKLVEEVDLKYTLGEKNVEILINSFALNKKTPIILPTENSNGVGISSIRYEPSTKEVTVNLSVGFSTANSFPFSVNDEILIENINVFSGKGYNSENYNYKLFTVTSVNENLGGFGSLTYSLDGLLNGSDLPGDFNADNSSGRIIPKKHFPTFNITLKTNDYLKDEEVISGSVVGKVQDWDPKSSLVKVISKDTFTSGIIIQGLASKTQGIITRVDSFDAFINLDSSSRTETGWKSNFGFLNDSIQRLQDSFYYQNFSYSIKSKVDYNRWNEVVSTLNHASGFEKFSDLQLESNLDSQSLSNLNVSTTSDLTNVEIINDIVEAISLNCYYDFDLVRENSLRIGNRLMSDEIIFANRILTDYAESTGNRVLSIDDISTQFNSNPRPTRFSEVSRFNVANVKIFNTEDIRSQKYIAYIRDKRFIQERQVIILTTLFDDIGNCYLNQYGRVETTYDMGSFDLNVDGTEGVLLFYPTKFDINDFDVTTLSYNLNSNALGLGTTSFGGVVDFLSEKTDISGILAPTTIVGIASTYRSAKILVNISTSDQRFEFDELTVTHDGTNAYILEYGQLTSHSPDIYSSGGLGTYHSYISGSNLNIDFIPNPGVAVSATASTFSIIFGSDISSGIGTYEMKHARLEGRSTNILSSPSPTEVVIYETPDIYDALYAIVQVSDLTNNIYQISELTLIEDETDAYMSEYGFLTTLSGLGTIGSKKSSGKIHLTFTPLENIDVNVKVYSNSLRYQDDDKDIVKFFNSEIQTDYGLYEGTDRDVKKQFNLTHKNDPIFERYFDGSDSTIVSINDDSIIIPNHFFVTGELVKYDTGINGSSNSIGITTTSFAGIGLTDKIPNDVYAIKNDSNSIKLARSAEDALNIIPKNLNITSVGIGTTHRIVATKQNTKVLVSIDNFIQSPIVSTSTTTGLSTEAFTTDDLIYFDDITSFFGGDLVKIDDEIMRIVGVGIGSTNGILVRRPWLGTNLSRHFGNSLVTKITGNYNIVDNLINFSDPPYGNVPLSSTTNPPDQRDWLGISVKSSFQGRSFIRSGIINSSEETYEKNYIFDDISSEFNGSNKQFVLKNNKNDVLGIENNTILLINGVFQGQGLSYDYTLSESAGETLVNFTGTATSVSYDVNNASIPRGGTIVSVGSTEGFGYQPLISAGGTSVVSISGTISSISIGNSGSGYRDGIQIVNVGVGTSSTGTPNIEFIGTAIVSGGHVVSVAITNPGTGYTSSNPPYVIFDDPLSYSNIPLIHSSGSSGLGTEARVDIVVGQGSNIIDFEITNTGYGYKDGDILTIPTTGIVGIPTIGSSFNEFQVFVQKTTSDEFVAWSIGELQVLDRIESKFDGIRKSFPLTVGGNLISIRASRGSNVSVQETLLVFINDILQEPGKSYVFIPGGSILRFIEPPEPDDTSKILFYRGSGSVDVVDVDILETVKEGDELTIEYDPSIGQSSSLKEEARTVNAIESIDFITTNPYFGPGNTDDETLERPVKWCKQTEDKIIDGQQIAKNRILYNALVSPTSYLIQPVGVGETILYVDNIRPFFNPYNESDSSLEFQNKIIIISNDLKVGASATAIVSIAGTISSIVINDGGVGYESIPSVKIQNSIGVGTTSPINATATASISSGSLTSINITNPGTGYTFTNPPIVLIESPSLKTETDEVINYEGDSGIVVGFGTTSIGGRNKIILDLYIPENSYLRQQSLSGTSSTISSLDVGDYFVVYDSNIGAATSTLTSSRIDDSLIGISTQFIDNVYQVDSSQIIERNVVGVGTIYINRILSNISSFKLEVFSSTLISFDSTVYTFDNTGGNIPTYPGDILSNYNFGNFSWGKITLRFRSKENSYNFYGNDGIGGISTSGSVSRALPLRNNNYISI